jgi:thermostable 8-oxoguanine DNA glycosylase
MRDWSLTEEDLRRAKKLLEEERVSVTYENMFCAGIYCILSTAEKYTKYKSVYDELLENKLNTPENIKKDKRKLKEIVGYVRFPNIKHERINKFASWWQKSDLPRKIIEDINSGRKNEFELRNQLAEEAPGIWYKGASLFMIKCGYENVVPLDIWMLRFLKDYGYDIKIPDYRRQSGPKPKEYIEYEKIITGIAKGYGSSPALFQFAVWSKHSTWNDRYS